MPYDFSVDKKTGLLLLTGYVLVSFLLFVAGFLFGLNYGLSSKVAEILARSSPPTVSQPAVAAAKPSLQTLQTSLPTPQVTPPSLTPSVPSTASAVLSPPSVAAASALVARAAAAPQTPAPQSTPTSKSPAATSPAAATPPAASPTPATAATAASQPASPPARQPGYSIQVGAFLDAANAARLAKNLQKMGYPANVFNFPDSDYRVWHAVRFGQFKHLEAAARAARRFERTEQLLAIVRRADSL